MVREREEAGGGRSELSHTAHIILITDSYMLIGRGGGGGSRRGVLTGASPGGR